MEDASGDAAEKSADAGEKSVIDAEAALLVTPDASKPAAPAVKWKVPAFDLSGFAKKKNTASKPTSPPAPVPQSLDSPPASPLNEVGAGSSDSDSWSSDYM